MGELGIADARHESMLRIWRQRVIECKNSGLTVAQWCEQNKIGVKTYFYWQKKVWDRETRALRPYEERPSIPELPQFAQVHFTEKIAEASTADIVLKCGKWSLEIRNTASQALLSQVMQMVTRNV